MEFTVSKADLVRELSLSQGVVEKKTTIPILSNVLLEAREDREHLDKALAHYRKTRKGLDDLASGTPGRKPIHPQYVTRVVSELAADDA